MKKLVSYITSVVILMTILCNPVHVLADTYYHNGSGSLGDANSWYDTPDFSGSNGFLPTGSDIGVIQSGITVHETSAVDINYLLAVESGGVLGVDAGGILNMINSSELHINAGGVMNVFNSGTVNISDASSISIEDGGTVNISNGGTSGTLNVNTGGTLNANSGSSLLLDTNGLLYMASGGVFSFTSSTTLNITGSNSGNINGGAGSISMDPAAILILNGGNALNIADGGSFTIDSGGRISVLIDSTCTIDTGGTLVITNSGELRIDSGTLHTSISSTLTNLGLVVNNGTWINESASIFTVTNGTTTNSNPMSYEIIGTSSVPISPYVLGDMINNGAINYNVTLSHTPLEYSATGLPLGLSIDSITGAITGTPAASGTGIIIVSSIGSYVSQAVSYTIAFAPDSLPPILSQIASSTTQTTATLTWTTDEVATSTILYGLTSAYGIASSSALATTSQSIVLTGLTAGTTYHFQLNSYDTTGNLATSTDLIFTTMSTPVVENVSLGSGTSGGSVSYGSGGGSGGGTSWSTIATTTDSTTSNTISTPLTKNNLCTPYISSLIPIKLGLANDVSNVKKLQTFLNTYEGATLVVDGVYKQVDVDAVKKFQTKYRTQILSPWGITIPTGYVFKTTLAKINAVVCGSTLHCPIFTKNTDLKSSHAEVSRVKNFLNQILGTSLNTNSSSMDLASIRAVSEFQIRYKEFILKPLGLSHATGLWYESTRKQANAFMGCATE